MDTQTSTHMTIKEAAAHYGVSEKTIRRRIKGGQINAEQINGRWRVYPAPDSVQDTDQTNDHPPDQSTELIEQMKSEIEHLRRQLDTKDTNIDQLNKILAMQTMQNTKLVEQLEAPPQTFYTKLAEWVGRIKNGKVRDRQKETEQVPPTHRTGTP